MNLPAANIFMAFFILYSCSTVKLPEKASVYYVSPSGSDSNDGSITSPWKTINKLNAIQLKGGDSVCFEGAQIFAGNIVIDSADAGMNGKPVTITSYGNGKAVIDGGNGTAMTITNTKFIAVNNLQFTGAGRKTGNTKDGVFISYAENIVIDSIDVSGFQKSGLLIYSSRNVEVTKVYAFDNGFGGITASGEKQKSDCRNITISYSKAENNAGDPTNFNNHSGNGILVGLCRNVTIEYCAATNNGWDMPRKGNGPVGIWCYEADSVTIQYCISYKNRTSPGSADGGGFDLDGGVTNSVIQYCLSYENEGSAFGLFQYDGASNWYNNTVRYCISENDGSVSAAHASIFIWNSSMDTNQLRDCYIYNNVIYNEKGAAISYEPQSANTGFRFYNNIFVGRDSLILGKETNSTYLGNNWYSIKGGFNAEGFQNFQQWATAKRKETLNGNLVGLNVNPSFNKAGGTTVIQPAGLKAFDSYKLPANSVLRNSGLNLEQLFGIKTGDKTFNQTAASQNGIGAIF